MLPSPDRLAELLSDPSRAVAPAAFPLDRADALRRGMYTWWADEQGRRVLGDALGTQLPALVYAGQAGATRWPSGRRSSATLLSRIGRQHIGGSPRSSTFRLTLTALLHDPLSLEILGGRRLTAASNRRVSDWIAQHLAVSIVPYDDRDCLGDVEAAVVRTLQPCLNLDHCLPSAARMRLTELRRRLSLPRDSGMAGGTRPQVR